MPNGCGHRCLHREPRFCYNGRVQLYNVIIVTFPFAACFAALAVADVPYAAAAPVLDLLSYVSITSRTYLRVHTVIR